MKNENFDFSKKSITRRGFTVNWMGEIREWFGHTFGREVVRFSEIGMTYIHVIGFQKLHSLLP